MRFILRYPRENKYTKMYLKYIYFMLSIQKKKPLQYVFHKILCSCIFGVLNWSAKSAKCEKLILCLMHFNCTEIELKSN